MSQKQMTTNIDYGEVKMFGKNPSIIQKDEKRKTIFKMAYYLSLGVIWMA